MTGILRGNLVNTDAHTQKCPVRTQREDGHGRGWSHAEPSQGMPKAARSWKRQRRILALKLLRELGPANTLISDF